MRREGAKVDVYNHPRLRGNVVIRFDKSRGVFRATYGNVPFETSTIGEIRVQLRQAIEAGESVTWEQVLKIEFGRRCNDEDTRVELDYSRFLVAKMCDGKIIKCEWEVAAKDRIEHSKGLIISYWKNGRNIVPDFKLPFTDLGGGDSPVYYVAYTEEMWQALHELTAALGKLQKKIIEVLGNEKLRAAFVAGTTRLLPSGEK